MVDQFLLPIPFKFLIMKNKLIPSSLLFCLKVIGVFLLCQQCLVAQTPATFNHTMTFNDQTITVNFTKFSVRSPAFQILEQQADGSFTIIPAGDVRTYIGTVQGIPGTIACAVLRDGGRPVQARVIFEGGYEWVDDGGDVTDFDADTLVTPRFPALVVRDGGAGNTFYSARVGVDASGDMYAAAGNSTVAAVEMAEFAILGNNLPFIRDASITHQIEKLVIRAHVDSDPYPNNSIANVWANDPTLATGTYDMLCLAGGFNGPPSGSGRIGDTNPYPFSLNTVEMNGDFGGITRHEIGHIWDVGHNEGGAPEGKTISTSNELAKFSGPGLEKLLRERDRKLAFLEVLPTPTIPLPPRAVDDVVLYEPGTGGNITINVLSNDNDVNNDAISILSFDTQTLNGLTVTQSGNQLLIATPTSFSAATDRFSYRIQDATGRTSIANVHLKANIPNDDLGYWTFEKSQKRVFDSGSRANHGVLINNASINANGELVLDGNRDYVKALPENVVTNTITYSGWIYREGDQVAETGIMMGNTTDSFEGMVFGFGNELAYRWNPSATFFDSGLIIPNQTWTFVAVVIAPTQATLYMQPTGMAMQTATNIATHDPVQLREDFNIGANPDAAPFDGNNPFFRGRLDDLRIKNRSLTAGEITILAARGLGAKDPTPYHGEARANGTVTLTWNPSAGATQQRLYFSSNYADVRDGAATADRGIMAGNTFTLNNLIGSYFWRIETTEATGTMATTDAGCIWNFTATPTNHSGICGGILEHCNDSYEVAGIGVVGNDIYSVGTYGTPEANYEYVQQNSPACAIPLQCDAGTDAGNRFPEDISSINGNLIVAMGPAGVTSLNFSTQSTCNNWIWNVEEFTTGVAVLGTRLFVAGGEDLREINPINGTIINTWTNPNNQTISRLTPGANGILYYTISTLTANGGIGSFNPSTGTFSTLPAPAGTTLERATGLTTDADGNILVAERGTGRILSVNPATGELTILVAGLTDVTDVDRIGSTIYIADKGVHKILRLTSCNPTDCPTDLLVTNTSMGNQQASNTIVTNGTINVTGDITYQAGTSITLNPVFAASAGSTFTAKIEACMNTLVREDLELSQANILIPVSLTIRPQLTEPHIFPNPFSQLFTIEYELLTPNEVYIHVFDLRGRLIAEYLNTQQQVTGLNTATISNENWIDGMYLVRIQVGGKVWTKRIIKQE